MSEVIVVTSGKGGVGKSTTTANLGVGLAMRGQKVVLIDTDTGLRNLDLLLGLENRIMYDLVDVIEGRVEIKKALVRHKKFDNLQLLPTSQVKDKSAVNPADLMVLCDELRKEYDYVIIDCPAGIEQGFQTAIAGADTAIVVTMPEVSAVRDADKIIGELGRSEKDNIKLIINRIRPAMVESGEMMDMDDIKVVTSANRGEPVVGDNDSQAGRAYANIVGRLMGEDIPFMEFEKEGFFTKLKKAFGLKKNG